MIRAFTCDLFNFELQFEVLDDYFNVKFEIFLMYSSLSFSSDLTL